MLSTFPTRSPRREDDRTILSEVFIEQDASLSVAEEPRQRVLTVEKRKIALILAVMLDEVEAIESRRIGGLPGQGWSVIAQAGAHRFRSRLVGPDGLSRFEELRRRRAMFRAPRTE